MLIIPHLVHKKRKIQERKEDRKKEIKERNKKSNENLLTLGGESVVGNDSHGVKRCFWQKAATLSDPDKM